MASARRCPRYIGSAQCANAASVTGTRVGAIASPADIKLWLRQTGSKELRGEDSCSAIHVSSRRSSLWRSTSEDA